MQHGDFIVFLHKVPPEGISLSLAIADPAKAGIRLEVAVDGPIRADLTVERFDRELRVSGQVRANLRLECSRCLAPFDLPVASPVEAVFAAPAPPGDEPRELVAEELEIQPLEQGAADLRGLIAEQIHLAVPLQPLCAPDCRGICPRCGADLAGGACGCRPEGADPRWEALRKLAARG